MNALKILWHLYTMGYYSLPLRLLGTRGHHVKLDKPGGERWSHSFTGIDEKGERQWEEHKAKYELDILYCIRITDFGKGI